MGSVKRAHHVIPAKAGIQRHTTRASRLAVSPSGNRQETARASSTAAIARVEASEDLSCATRPPSAPSLPAFQFLLQFLPGGEGLTFRDAFQRAIMTKQKGNRPTAGSAPSITSDLTETNAKTQKAKPAAKSNGELSQDELGSVSGGVSGGWNRVRN